jgi:hypothetical protein|tara:strand:+ start:402 stop:1088 length:687 start_codon:yes stop_codon:yes gene_type:complete
MIRNYNETQLEDNYNRFIAAIKKVFTGDRLEKLLHMYSPDELGNELAMAPASGKLNFHSAYPGGYIDHVMNVATNAYKIKKMFEASGGIINFTDEELLFAAFHHDLGKLGDGKEPYYLPQTSEWHQKNKKEYFTHNPKLQYFDVTDRAFWLLNQYGIKYTQKEQLGIHMADGLYNDATKKYFISYNEDFQVKTDLPYILHWADHMSTRIENSEYRKSTGMYDNISENF